MARKHEGGIEKHMSANKEAEELILVAEDDEDILALITFRLKKAGYEVVPAKNGAEAYEVALDRQPNLGIFDVMMPKMDGYELTEKIRANEATSKMPIIMLTASVQDESVSRGFHVGVDDYMKKPFSPQELLQRVQAILGRR